MERVEFTVLPLSAFKLTVKTSEGGGGALDDIKLALLALGCVKFALLDGHGWDRSM